MQTLTLSQKVRLDLFSWRSFLAILILATTATTQQVLAQTFYDDAVTLTQQPTGTTSQPVSYAGKRLDAPYSTYPRLGNVGATPVVSTPNIGTYDLNNTSQLTLNTANVIVSAPGRGSTYNSVRLLYRVYLSSSLAPSYTYSVPLTQTGTDSYGDPIYQNTTDFAINLLNGLTSGGTYSIDVRFQVALSDGTYQADPDGAYSLSFDVTAPPITPAGGTTTWQSTSSSDWFLASNWTNGVPNASANAIIPENTAGTNIVFPVLNDLTRHYVVKNLTLQGNTASGKAQITIQNALLRVYGDISQITGGLVGAYSNNIGIADSTQNSTLVLAGADQFVTGQLRVPDIIVTGSGTKSVLNALIPSNTLSFRPTNATAGVIVQSAGTKTNSDGSTSYVFDTTGNSLINLTTTGIINANAGSNETNSSYVKGILTASGQLIAGNRQIFGNIGLEFLPNHSAANITVTRTIGDPLIGPTTPTPGITPVPIKRQYQIVGDDNSASSATTSSANDVLFHYSASTYELNGITESNLTMFRTNTGSAPYTPVNGTLDVATHTVTQIGLPTFSNFYLTLGDKTNPLPVSLIAFTATRSNQNVLLAWATATEQNSAGFEVQVSTDGASFRKLAFVASQSPNSSQKLAYTYTDVEAGKTGTRYYRLRQLDITGEEAFSPVRVVTFDGTAAATALSAYPNPFADKVAFNLDATATGTNGNAHVQLLDMTGRIVREQNLTIQNASLTLDNLSDLRSGLYMVRITLPDGSAKTLRVQKQ